MFKDCENLLQLNKKRIELMHEENANIIEINKAYQERKKELQVTVLPYKKINFVRPVLTNHAPYVVIPYAGEAEKAGTLVYTEKGFVI